MLTNWRGEMTERRLVRATVRTFATAGVFAAAALSPTPSFAAPMVPPATRPAATPPTQLEVVEAFEKGENATVLAKATAALAVKGKAAEDYNRHELWRMRAEVLLRMKQVAASARSFGDAAAEAGDRSTTAIDVATELLLRRTSAGLIYKPKTPVNGKVPAPIDVLDQDNRKKALSYLFADELAAGRAEVRAAGDAETLPAIAAAAPTLRRLRMLELAATGSDDTLTDLTVGMDARAARLLAEKLDRDVSAVSQIEIRSSTPAMSSPAARAPRANLSDNVRPAARNNAAAAGMSASDVKTITDIGRSSVELMKTSAELGAAIGLPQGPLADVGTQAEQLAKRCEALLHPLPVRQQVAAPPRLPATLPVDETTRGTRRFGRGNRQ